MLSLSRNGKKKPSILIFYNSENGRRNFFRNVGYILSIPYGAITIKQPDVTRKMKFYESSLTLDLVCMLYLITKKV